MPTFLRNIQIVNDWGSTPPPQFPITFSGDNIRATDSKFILGMIPADGTYQLSLVPTGGFEVGLGDPSIFFGPGTSCVQWKSTAAGNSDIPLTVAYTLMVYPDQGEDTAEWLHANAWQCRFQLPSDDPEQPSPGWSDWAPATATV